MSGKISIKVHWHASGGSLAVHTTVDFINNLIFPRLSTDKNIYLCLIVYWHSLTFNGPSSSSSSDGLLSISSLLWSAEQILKIYNNCETCFFYFITFSLSSIINVEEIKNMSPKSTVEELFCAARELSISISIVNCELFQWNCFLFYVTNSWFRPRRLKQTRIEYVEPYLKWLSH